MTSTRFADGFRYWTVVLSGKPGCQTGRLTLYPGMNTVGQPFIPEGTTAYGLMRSIGIGKVSCVQRYDSERAEWKTASVWEGGLVGEDFAISPGEGVLVYVTEQVDDWRP